MFTAMLLSGCMFLAELDRPISRQEMAAVDRRWRARNWDCPGEQALFFLRGCLLATHLKEGMREADVEKVLGPGCRGAVFGGLGFRHVDYYPLWVLVSYRCDGGRVNGEACEVRTAFEITTPLDLAAKLVLYHLGLLRIDL
jgi:hypothetical protein